MKKLTLLVFITLSFLSVVVAQTTKMDSLENLLQQHTEKDTSRVNLLNNFAESALQIEQEKSIEYAEEALELANSLHFGKGEAESLYWSGLYHLYRAKYEKGLDYLQKSIHLYEDLGNKQKKAVCLKYIGIIYEYLGNYDLSIESYQKALKINEEINNKQGKANCLHNIGIIYHIQGNYPLSLEYYQQSLKINEEVGSKQHIANCLNNIGAIYFEQADYVLAFPYYNKSYKISKEIAYKPGEARGLNNIGEVYRLQDSLTLALTYYQKSLKVKNDIGDDNGIARTENNIGRIYYSLGKHSLALDFYQMALEKSKEVNDRLLILDSYANLGSYYLGRFNFKKALDYTQKSFTIAKELENLSQQKRLFLQISEIYTATKNYEEALVNYIQYKELNDSVFNEKNIKEVTRLEYQFEFEKEKQAIELEQQKKDAITAEKSKYQYRLNIVFIVGFVLMTSLVLIILKSFIQKRRKNNILRKQKKEIEEKNEALILRKGEIQNFAFELEKANKTKDKFFSIIAHDLKNPFNTLLGFSDLLLENHTTIDEDEREMYIKYINESSLKTYRLLENLLTWARSQTGQIKFKTEIFDASVLITETVALLEESAWNKEIKLIVNAEKDLSIKADKDMINTTIRNLVINAIKFTPKGGVIMVNSKAIADENNQKFAEIFVKDSGVGIPNEIQSKLFNIAEDVTTKGTEEETGTGLGLILCKEFIDTHNGKIWVESEIGKGSKFIFKIPLLN